MAPPVVLTRLKYGDELASYPGHTVPSSRNLAALYRTTLKAPTERAAYLMILEANKVANTSTAINAWVKSTGGKQLGTFTDAYGKTQPQYVFSKASTILLPPGGPRPPVSAPPGVELPSVEKVAAGALIGRVLIGGALWAWATRKKKKDDEG